MDETMTRDAWQSIEECSVVDYERVDLWMNIHASPCSFGIADTFRVTNAYRKDGKWFDADGELYLRYITHWMPIPVSPSHES